MRQWWIKLVIGALVVALLVFAGVKLHGALMGLLSVVSTNGNMEIQQDDTADQGDAIWTQPPYIIDDSAYDDVSSVQEYDAAAPDTTQGK